MWDDRDSLPMETSRTDEVPLAGGTAPLRERRDYPPLAVDDISDFGASKRNVVPKFGYLLDSFVPALTESGSFSFALADYRAATAARGWKRVFVADAISGRPGSYVQLWRAPFDDIRHEANVAKDQPEFHRDFVERTAQFTRRSLGAMVYDPAESSSASGLLTNGPPTSLLINEVNVKKGAMARFAHLKKNFFIRAVEGPSFGWKLVAAGLSGVGAQRRVLQIWKLPNFDVLPFTMRRIGQNETYRTGLAPCIEDENQMLFEVLDWG